MAFLSLLSLYQFLQGIRDIFIVKIICLTFIRIFSVFGVSSGYLIDIDDVLMVEIHDFIDLFMIYMETKGGFVCFGIVDEKINERIVDFRKENIFL